jgi:hypothetical protein
MLYDRHGNSLGTGDSEWLADIAFTHNLLIFTDSLRGAQAQPLIRGTLADGRNAVLCDKFGRPSFIRWKRKGSRWISTLDRWGNTLPRSYEALDILQEIFSYVGVGYYPTSAALGQATQRYVYALNDFKKHTSPSLAAEEMLRDHAVGGIVQTPGKGAHFERAIQLDMASAYLSEYTYHPDGSAYYFTGETGGYICYATYFARCVVTIPRTLPLGPFPIRVNDYTRPVRYPILPGSYTCYLWKEQVEDARAAGCEVTVGYGFGWDRFTYDNGAWAAYAYYLRKNAPSSLEPYIKSLANGAMGKFASSRIHYALTAQETCEPLIVEHEPTGLYIEESENHGQYVNLAWYYYTIMRTNRTVYHFALPFALSSRLVAIDYDSITVIEENERGRFLKKKSPPTFYAPPGHWTWEPIFDVHVLDNRQMVWKDEKGVWQRKIPGTKRGSFLVEDEVFV